MTQAPPMIALDSNIPPNNIDDYFPSTMDGFLSLLPRLELVDHERHPNRWSRRYTYHHAPRNIFYTCQWDYNATPQETERRIAIEQDCNLYTPRFGIKGPEKIRMIRPGGSKQFVLAASGIDAPLLFDVLDDKSLDETMRRNVASWALFEATKAGLVCREIERLTNMHVGNKEAPRPDFIGRDWELAFMHSGIEIIRELQLYSLDMLSPRPVERQPFLEEIERTSVQAESLPEGVFKQEVLASICYAVPLIKTHNFFAGPIIP